MCFPGESPLCASGNVLSCPPVHESENHIDLIFICMKEDFTKPQPPHETLKKMFYRMAKIL